MIPTVSASGRLALLAGIGALSLAAGGRRGPLEAPPDPAAAAAQRQREEVRRQRQGAGPTANTTGAAPAGPTEVPAGGRDGRPDGSAGGGPGAPAGRHAAGAGRGRRARRAAVEHRPVAGPDA